MFFIVIEGTPVFVAYQHSDHAVFLCEQFGDHNISLWSQIDTQGYEWKARNI